MATTMQSPQRQATPARWQAAARRAISNHIQIRQLAGSGAWIATSGSDATVAYSVEVYNGVPVACDCPAGEAGDPVCQHRAAVAVLFGLLDPEPEPPAPVTTVMTIQMCPACSGGGVVYIAGGSGLPYPTCPDCVGTGRVETKGGKTSTEVLPPARCACNAGRLTLAYDYSGDSGPEITARLACVGRDGLRSCGYGSPVMSVVEAQTFLDLRFARRQLATISAAPAVA